MLVASDAVTKSARKITSWIALGVVLVSGVLVCLVNFSTPRATIDGASFAVEVMRTPEQRQKGLSGRDSLPAHTGMAFDFAGTGRQCMWMKDMRFSIAMVWLDKDHRVLRVEQRIDPSTYPETFCANNTRYVLELPAESVPGVRVGDKVQLMGF